MIYFFGNESKTVFAVASQMEFSAENISKLNWLFQAELLFDTSTHQPKSVLADLG